MNGAQLLVRELQQRGVTFIATLCGHGLDALDKACLDAGLRLVDVRNEQAASYIAEVTGRLSRTVGVCAVSSGVAHVNALTGICNAHFDGAPMLLITGSAPTATMGLGHFQDMDHEAIAAPLCKYTGTIDRAERIPQHLHDAFTAALSGRPGPVQLTIPQNVLAAEIDTTWHIPTPAPPAPTLCLADPSRIDEIAHLLANAQRPLLVAGSGLYYASGEKILETFAKTFSVPVVVPIWDRGTVLNPIEEFMGVIGAATGGPRLLEDADLILLAGADCDYRVGYLQPPAVHPEAQIVRFHADPAFLQRRAGAHLAVPADPASALNQLTQAGKNLNIASKSAWLKEAQKRRDKFRQNVAQTPRTTDLHALDIVNAVQAVLTDETILLVDGGNIGQWAHQILCNRYPGHWLTCGASGVVGSGLPGAMAARLQYPDRPIILISGDGSLTFTIAEFETAARQNLSFVVLLADDQAWGITLTGHQESYGEGITSELGPIQYDQMAEAFGAHGVRIKRPEDILPTIKEGLKANRPTLIHVPIVRSNPTQK
ncbi:MAG: thiamine pyrophosphate-binding protein [bacterium]|nr:thiamine pyrophosphate-binding protein [bacterium]